MTSQTQQILEYLQRGNSITPIDALNLFGSFRLGARIKDLRNMKYPIKSKLVTNGRKKWAEYWLDK